jgi:predicted enzyme related to lactoylglutathione lyase
LTIATPTASAHPVGDPVIRAGSTLQYVDAELPQDVCAAGRVQRVGIASQPSLTSSQTPFATGLSSTGRLTSAVQTSKFYGSPLVAWTPAYNADLYEIQYSKTSYPFKPEIDPRSTVRGFLTFDTSDVLPLTSGTWYYRVRGIDFSLPSGVQQMSWSDPEKIVVSPPTFKLEGSAGTTFKVVGGTTKTASKFYNMTGFSLSVPTTWTRANTGTLSVFAASTRAKSGYVTHMDVEKVRGRGSLSLTAWADALAASARLRGAVGTVAQRVVSLPGGNAVYLAFAAKDTKGRLAELVEYFFDAGATAYGMGFETLSSLVPQYRASFTKIAQSFRAK